VDSPRTPGATRTRTGQRERGRGRRCAGREAKSDTAARQEEQLAVQANRLTEAAGLATSVETFCQRVQGSLAGATFEQKGQLVELLIDRVIVTGEDVEIRYVIPTSQRSERIRFCHLQLDYFLWVLLLSIRCPACPTTLSRL